MRKLLGLILILAPAVTAEDRGSTMDMISAMREYYALLGLQGNGNIESIRDRLIKSVPRCSQKAPKSVRTQLVKGFKSKYKKDAAFHKCLAEVLASNGKRGLNQLYKTYRSMGKAPESRVGIAEAMAGCGNYYALSLLLKVMSDKDPNVAAAAVTGCANLVPKENKHIRETMKLLIAHYTKVTASAQGKAKDSRERKRYDALKPAFDKTLDAYSGGEKLDSASSWDAWWREQAKPR